MAVRRGVVFLNWAQVLRRGHVIADRVAVSIRTVLVFGQRIVMHTLSSRYMTIHENTVRT